MDRKRDGMLITLSPDHRQVGEKWTAPRNLQFTPTMAELFFVLTPEICALRAFVLVSIKFNWFWVFLYDDTLHKLGSLHSIRYRPF